MAPKPEINSFDTYEDTLTEDEKAALSGEDDFEIDGEFDEIDVKLAQETMRERLEREEDEKTAAEPPKDEAAGEGDDDLEKVDVADAGDGDDGDDAFEDEKTGDDAAKPDEKTEPAGAAEEATQGDAADDKPPVAAEAPKPDVSKLYNEAMERVDSEIEASQAELSKKLEDMEITTEEFNEQLKSLNASRRDRISGAVADATFDFTVADYLRANPSLNTEAHISGLNNVFASIDSNPLYAGLSDYDKIEKAHAMYHSQVQDARARGLNIGDLDEPARLRKPKAADPAPKKDDAAQTPADADKTPAKKTNTPPKTLRTAPASDFSGDGGDGKSAVVQKILNSNDPDAIEKALLAGQITTEDLEALG